MFSDFDSGTKKQDMIDFEGQSMLKNSFVLNKAKEVWVWIALCRKTGQVAAYSAVIPEEQHTAVGKETRETAHVERWNNTLRQRLARFVRMTLSFSKSVVMHEACLLLFLHRYNLDKAILLK